MQPSFPGRATHVRSKKAIQRSQIVRSSDKFHSSSSSWSNRGVRMHYTRKRFQLRNYTTWVTAQCTPMIIVICSLITDISDRMNQKSRSSAPVSQPFRCSSYLLPVIFSERTFDRRSLFFLEIHR